MAKRPNPLAAAVAGMVPAQPAAPKKPEPIPVPAPAAKTPRPPSREGKSYIAVYIDPAAHKQLKLFAVHNDRGIQDCMLEAIDLFFQKHGLNMLARAPADE
ncbi:ribbon-helix-helix domain-containing protein [Methylobacterium nodulans]|uniref:Antitoxin-like ribbon-helix-helix domain-containing protein n=1 Tax=Methylobacterium nodulans (strain LMG 21967 / CNCM I-2342 / ORS 2060) TaxID=460265 RepID=B8IY19_METNO|nr:ribbon-helix-helix domain-containing protein [Methylobacterium nodulans]ACL63309.1 hypothetical protein Mnod_7716 [Methylobacterium nodulans ORS 2060]